MAHDIAQLQDRIGVYFKTLNYLKEALTHRSYLNENPSWELPHNERLEFLGDAVLELVVTENLFIQYPQHDEGRLTSIRAALVNYISLARCARDIELEKYLLLSRGEEKDTGKAREVIMANAFEALLGAIYLDQGYEETKKFIERVVFVYTDDIIKNDLYKDAKSNFQEIAQERQRVTPTYKVLDQVGPEHKKIFRVGVFLKDKKIAEGEGTSKQEAEIEAAKNALYVFKTIGD